MAEVQTTTEAGETTQLFVEFVMMQTQNTAHCLGQMPDPRTGQAYVNIPMARLLIDQLMMIRSKTAGNLSAEEQKIIDSAVQEMDQAFHYVAARTEGFHPGESLAYDPEPVAPVASAPAPAAEPTPAPPAAEPAATPPPEENRKRFTKSYGA
jgi:hypothetical protein